MTEKAEEWVGRVEWMSKVNRQVKADRWRMMLDLMGQFLNMLLKCGRQMGGQAAES